MPPEATRAPLVEADETTDPQFVPGWCDRQLVYLMYETYDWYMTVAHEFGGDDPTEVSMSEVREHLADLLDLVDRDGRRVYVTKHGRRVGALADERATETTDRSSAETQTASL